ncbi:carbohydrate ABC transporter permease [Streptacidiphilus jiangxiensis]|uniref:Multiple sugar transport system permease protein n=1 Tax=Streptacidiphilus jiangxiensis TaxID=235985 RepID=A0A1H7T336_STRJI|nr:sugar ABC transporter permease [Streptacidiphilus jiangxiensis]SEL79138.1 multiple sugar transport system permease protein [Streptacidiphilus jiangxiensis]
MALAKAPSAPAAVPAAAATGPRRRLGVRVGEQNGHPREWIWGYLMILPLVAGLACFYLWPIAQSCYYSFTTWGVFGGQQWVGLANYRAFLSDPQLPKAAWNTVLYSLLMLLAIPFSIVLAALLNQLRGRHVGLYRTLYFLPVVSMPAAVAMVWRWLYNGDYGLINYLLSLVGVHGPHWVSDPRFTVYAMAVVGIWSSLGYNMIIFSAGLKGIPRHYYEAAELDGAGRVRQFFSITLPLLSPSIFFVSVLTVIGGLQMFDTVLMMLGRANPALAGSKTIAYLFYEDVFLDNRQGMGCAIAVVLMAVLLVLTAVQFRLQKKWVHYE